MATFRAYRFVGNLRAIQFCAKVVSGREREFNHVNARFTEHEVVQGRNSDRELVPVLRYFVGESCGAFIRVFGDGLLRLGVSFIANLVANLGVRVRGIIHLRYFRYHDRLVLVVHVVWANDPLCDGATWSYVVSCTVSWIRH